MGVPRALFSRGQPVDIPRVSTDHPSETYFEAATRLTMGLRENHKLVLESSQTVAENGLGAKSSHVSLKPKTTSLKTKAKNGRRRRSLFSVLWLLLSTNSRRSLADPAAAGEMAKRKMRLRIPEPGPSSGFACRRLGCGRGARRRKAITVFFYPCVPLGQRRSRNDGPRRSSRGRRLSTGLGGLCSSGPPSSLKEPRCFYGL